MSKTYICGDCLVVVVVVVVAWEFKEPIDGRIKIVKSINYKWDQNNSLG